MRHKIIILLLFTSVVFSNVKAQRLSFDRKNTTMESVSAYASDCDMGPTIIDGMLYFSSLRTETGSNSRFFNILAMPVNEATEKNALRETIKDLCTDYHDGPLSYCEATGELFVTVSDIDNSSFTSKKKKKKEVPLKIVVYKSEGNKWVYKEDFPFNKPPYSVAHPAINTSGDTLVFSSNQPGGFGNSDLYMSVREKGVWQTPVNLGNKVNTRKREITPFINTDGMLYFSSDGLKGKGSFDIYAINLASSKTGKPINLPKPINGGMKDYGMVIHPNQQYGFMVSNRKKGRNNDAIFALRKKDFTFKTVTPDSVLIKQLDDIFSRKLSEIEEAANQKKEKNEIYNNVNYHLNYKITDANNFPDLTISCWYTLANDTLRFGKNCYNMGKYNISDSNTGALMLSMLKECIEEDLSTYFTAGRKTNISIHSEPDALPGWEKEYYDGEWGNNLNEMVMINHQAEFVEINNDSILDDTSLAFLRSYAIRAFLTEEIDMLRHTRNTFTHHLTKKSDINSNYEWNKIEITIHNAFANF